MRISIGLLAILAACGSSTQSNTNPPDAAPDAAADAPADSPVPDAPPLPVITARWAFSTYANRAAPPSDPCPSGFSSAALHVRPWDPMLGQFVPGGIEVISRFSCASKQGAIALMTGIFLIWVSIEDAAGATVYARSGSTLVDTTGGDQTIALPTVFSDAGYLDLSWDLLDANQLRLACAAALGTSGTIASTVVSVDSNTIFVDKFRCSDGLGTAGPFPAGSYDVTVVASSGPGQDVGASAPIPGVSVTIPNGLTHLGHVAIPISPR